MRTATRKDWWVDDPAVVMCEIDGCGCPIQRTVNGTVEDGMKLHIAAVHTERIRYVVAKPMRGHS